MQRVAAVPAVFVVTLLEPVARLSLLLPLAICFLAIELMGLVALFGPGWQRVPFPALLALDCVAVAVAVGASGGRDSDARYFVPMLVIAAAVGLPRGLLVRLGLLMIGLSTVSVLLVGGDASPLPFLLACALALLLAHNIAWVGAGNTDALKRVADDRRTLLTHAMRADQIRRQALSQTIHDDALQTLLAARQDLEEAGEPPSERGMAGIEAAITSLREAIHELHSSALTGPLPQALRVLAARAGRQLDLRPELAIDDTSTRHDDLLYAVARTLLADTLDDGPVHSLRVALFRDGGDVVLEINDDKPVGGADELVALGLATSTEQIAEAGGDLTREAGTVRVRLPA